MVTQMNCLSGAKLTVVTDFNALRNFTSFNNKAVYEDETSQFSSNTITDEISESLGDLHDQDTTFEKKFQHLRPTCFSSSPKSCHQHCQPTTNHKLSNSGIQIESLAETFSKEEMDEKTFVEESKDCSMLICNILKNTFVIPEFKKFCSRLRSIFKHCKLNDDGVVASYIPQLATFRQDQWGMAVCTVDGQRYSIGDKKTRFCLQSASKPLTYALALTELGADTVHSYVGYEPSGVPFNSISLNSENKPHNPMVNPGAIVITSLMKTTSSLEERFAHLLEAFRNMSGHDYVGFSEETFLSERSTADRNFSIAYLLKEMNCFPEHNNFHETMDLYFMLCSTEINCQSGAVLAATLANGGICPLTGQRVVSAEAVRDTLSLMHSCGMYDYSGQFAFQCGLPAKSGVSGVVLLVVPNLLGICTWSPPLDKQGNSCRGLQFCQELVKKFNFHYQDNSHGPIDDVIRLDPRGTRLDKPYDDVMDIIYSAYKNDLVVLQRMFMRGVDMNQTDYDSRTALHVAACEGHLEIVQFLIEACKVDPTTRDRWNSTALHEAKRFQQKHIADYLRSFMPKKNKKKKKRKSLG